MPAHPLTEHHWPHLAALIRDLEGLSGTKHGSASGSGAAPVLDLPALADALKVYQDRGGVVPWKKA